jgi:hypothetical protein
VYTVYSVYLYFESLPSFRNFEYFRIASGRIKYGGASVMSSEGEDRRTATAVADIKEYLEFVFLYGFFVVDMREYLEFVVYMVSSWWT